MKKYIKFAAIVFIIILLAMCALNAYQTNLYIKDFKAFTDFYSDLGSDWFEPFRKQYTLEISKRILMAITDLIFVGLIICLVYLNLTRKTKIACISLTVFLFAVTVIIASMDLDYGRYSLKLYGGSEQFLNEFEKLSAYVLPHVIKLLFCIAGAVVSVIYLVDVIKNEKSVSELEQVKSEKIARLQAKIDKLQGYEATYETNGKEIVISDEDDTSK